MYQVSADNITNDAGEVAIQYYKAEPKDVIVQDGTIYSFTVRGGISLAWVRPEHVMTVYNLTRGCCGDRQSRQFHIASEISVRLWLGMSGRKESSVY